MKEILSYYCHYNLWANKKIALFFSDKPEDLLSAPIENSFPSIHKTVLHILSAEKSWLARLSEDPMNNKQVDDDFLSTQALLHTLLHNSEQLIQFVEKQEEEFFNQDLAYNTWDGTAWEMSPKIMIQHCTNHSTYHRGQLITLARQLGMKEDLPSTDLLYYSREQSDLGSGN